MILVPEIALTPQMMQRFSLYFGEDVALLHSGLGIAQRYDQYKRIRQGLVKIVPYKGTTVTRLNREIVDELIYERTAVEARVLRDFAPHCTPEQRALIRRRADAYAALAQAETPDYNRLYEADRLLHETWFASMGKMYLFRTLQNAHADYSRFRMLDTITSGGLAEVIADHQNLIDAIERCDLAAFEPLVERHLYGGIRRLGSRLTEEYADYFEPEK